MALKRSQGAVFEVVDSDGFGISGDDMINRLRSLESGRYIYNGLKITRSENNILEVTDPDGFSLSIDDMLSRLMSIEKAHLITADKVYREALTIFLRLKTLTDSH